MSFLDLSEVKSQSMEALPAGKYLMCVDDAEFKQSQAGTEYMALKLKVIEGEMENRVVFHNLNLFHENEKVANISKGQLKKLMEVNGMENFNFASKEDMLNKVLGMQAMVTTGIRKSSEYGDQAQVKSFSESNKQDTGEVPF